MTLSFEVLTTETELLALADEWRQLHARVRGGPQTDCDGFLIWWRRIGKFQKQTLHVVTGKKDGKLTALLPLTVKRRLGARILQAESGLLPECDVLCDEPETAAPLLWQAARQSSHYDFARIKAVYDGTVCARALGAIATRQSAMDSFYMRFDWKTSADWLASLSSKVRNDFKRNLRRLEEKGAVRYEVCTAAPLPMDIIDRMVKQKAAWCKLHGKDSIFADEHIFEYFHELLETMAKEGRLFFAWLTSGGHEVAYDLRFVYNGVLHGYVLAYDLEWTKFSPGNVMISQSVSWAIDHGLKGLDFKYTSESASQKFFKLKFCNETGLAHEYTFSKSVKGRLIENAFIALRALGQGMRGALQALKTGPKKEKAGENKAARPEE